MIHRRSFMIAGSGALLAGCATPGLETYAGQKPALRLRSYFDGKVRAHGLFAKRSGEVVRRFVVDMDCRWSGPAGAEQGVLDERFVYDDGETQRRIWRLTHLGQERYRGLADDVLGEAQGQASGSAFRWSYTLKLPVDGREIEVQFDDWMHQIDERTVLNRATMSKFGVRLGEVLLSFSKT